MVIPKHLAIIPDGNRRCAKRLMKKPWKGHAWGLDKIKEVFGWAKERGIKILTFYTLSLENLEKRPKRELNFLFRLAKKEINDIIKNKNNFIHKNRIRMLCFGNMDRLPEGLRDDLKKLEKVTESYSDYHINLAIAYGGRQEILHACQDICQEILKGRLKPNAINDVVFKHHLQTNGHPDPDMILRTGGEERLSNFLIYQSAYAELFFIKSFWPELKKDEFMETIDEFAQRQRRFGR